MKKILLLCLTVILMSSCKPGMKTYTYGNTHGNIENLGMVCAYSNEVFYSFNQGIFKMHENGTNKIQLTDEAAYYLNLSAPWLYYIEKEDRNIYRVHIESFEKEKLSDVKVRVMHLVDSKLFYNAYDNKTVYCMDLKNMQTSQIEDIKGEKLCFYEGWLYYTNLDDDSKLYRIKENGKENTKLVEDSCDSFITYKQRLYYTTFEKTDSGTRNHGILYCLSLENSSKTTILEKVTGFNISEDLIFTNVTHEKLVWPMVKCKLDGSGEEILVPNSCVIINTAGNWVYFVNIFNAYLDTHDRELYVARFDSGLFRIKADGSGLYELEAEE